MAPPRRWASEAARQAAYRDRRKGIEHPDDYYNASRSDTPEKQSTYFIQAGDGQIKVGIALHPEKRLRELQTGSPTPLKLLGTIAAGRTVEALLHDTFKAQGHHLIGEWYSAAIHDDVMTLLRILGSTRGD